MPEVRVTVVVPTLTAGPKLAACIRSLEQQTLRDSNVIVVDNSGQGLARGETARTGFSLIENPRNAGFGAAINQGFRVSAAPFIATLNDDAVARPQWLEALVNAMEESPETGMCASCVLLPGGKELDSAGMLLCADGSSKQRGHRQPPENFREPSETLFPSGAAALFRRRMLEDIGLFDEAFFLYCEDTDLGLRARWAGWRGRYVPEAIVEHRYSQSGGRASPLKAYFVERNRLLVVAKNFPAGMALQVPFTAMARYFWHAVSILRGEGAAAEFRREGNHPLRLFWYVVKSHLAVARRLGHVWRQRRDIRRRARISPADFQALATAHSISPKQVAAL